MGICFVFAVLAGWTRLASQLDGQAYDWLFAARRPAAWPQKAILLGIDEASLIRMGGVRNLRKSLAQALDVLCPAKPLAVAIDLMLSSEEDPSVDESLARSFERCPSVVLATDIVRDGKSWEEPAAPFRRQAASLGHVHADPDPVSRRIPLEKAVNGRRYWALALEAFRLSRQAGPVLESPADLEIGMTRVPAPRATARSIYIRYAPAAIDEVSLAELLAKPELALRFSNRVAFAGFTDQSAARDRLMTPMGTLMTGVEIHANLFETLNQGVFRVDAGPALPVFFAFLAALGAGMIFTFLSGWIAWAVAAAFLIAYHWMPIWLFDAQVFLPPFMPLAAAWISVIAAASFHHFVIRRRWQRSEADKTRYQQAIHFVTHEMKTPLTAIQGSSEIMSRYRLNEDKQKQIAQMIHSESKRLAQMIQTFLDVERLAGGEMELKKDHFHLSEVMLPALERARVLAEKKEMQLEVAALPPARLRGDREMLEYAIYNLLNNAVKYSGSGTAIRCGFAATAAEVQVTVADQGMGMDAADLKKIFDRFYRSKRAEESGIAGTGIGLSIVHEIVKQHGGRIDVESEVGKGSAFTVSLPREPNG
jgi:signal transduction histidine kinase